jgi:hypothetical protein
VPSRFETPEDYSGHWLAQSVAPDYGANPFIRFMTAWIAFNSLYAHQGASIDGDWNQVQRFADDERLQEMHGRLLRHPDLPEYAESINVLAAHGVRNLRSGNVRRIRDSADLRSVLACIYQVRCNLIHGGKRTDDSRDQQLTAAGFIVIANLLSFYFTRRIVGGWKRFEQ